MQIVRPNILSLIGALVFLASWVAQNTLYDYWNGRQSDLQRAETIYLSTLSTTLVMNAMIDVTRDKVAKDSIHFYNDMNFKMGLDYMAGGLSAQQLKHWGKEINAEGADLNKVGERLMDEVSKETKSIESWKSTSRWLFFITYMIGSVLLVCAEVLKSGSSVR